MQLPERIALLESLLEQKEALANATTENNKAIEAAKKEIADLMIDSELERVTVNGRNYTLKEVVKYNKVGGADEELFDALRNDGLGDLIVETVNPRTLQSALTGLAEQHDGVLPENYADIIREYRFFDIGRTKAGRR